LTKIPFAIHKPTGRMVEVSSVVAGRACECICPSCRQSVQARQGSVYEWHFAHDGAPGTTPGVECDISFHVCCRQFIIEAALAGQLSSLMTPGRSISYEVNGGMTRAQRVARPMLHENLIWKKGVSNFDIAADVEGYGLHIYFSYPDRESPVIPEGVHEAGFLKIDITPIKKSIERDKRNGQNILEQADVLFREEDCKLWLSHPRLYTKAFIEEKGKILDEYKKKQEDVKRVKMQRIDEMAARRDSSELQKQRPVKKEQDGVLYAHRKISPPLRLVAKHDALSSDESLIARFYSTVYKLYLDAGRTQQEAITLLLQKEPDTRRQERLAWMEKQRRKF